MDIYRGSQNVLDTQQKVKQQSPYPHAKKRGGKSKEENWQVQVVVFKIMTSYYLIILGMIVEEGLESGGVNGRLSWPKQRIALVPLISLKDRLGCLALIGPCSDFIALRKT